MVGTTELLIILFIIIIVFGAAKLPQLGDALGRSISNFRKAVKDASEDESTDAGSSGSDDADDSGKA